MIRIKWFTILVISLVVTSCGNTKEELKCEIPDISHSQTANNSDNLNVAIYVDGSGSMLGYVQDGETNYTKALKSLRNVFELTGKLPVEYYRIGTPIQKITGNDYYSYGGSPVFYDGTNAKFKAVSSPIDAAVIPIEKDQQKMTVIITDLEQNSGDVTKLSKKIQDTYFNADKKDYAVGIWAVKSEFNGKVYVDELNSIKTFVYNSGKQPDKFRPFYVLFIGPYQDIRYYFEQLQKYDANQLLANAANSKLMIFHPDHIIDKVMSLEKLPESLPKGITRPISLVKDGVAVNKGNSPYELLQINSSQKEVSTINYSIPFAPSEYSLFFDPKSLKVKVKAEKFDEFAKKFTVVDSNSELNNAIEIKDWQIIPGENKLNFSAVVNPSKFPEPGVYKLNFNIFSPTLEIPTWWKEWDWQSKTSEEDGTKTHGVEEFFTGLKNRTETMKAEQSQSGEDHQSLVGRLCYAVQKN